MLKFCSECHEEKSVSEFCKDRSRKDQLSYCCKTCKSDRNTAYRAANQETEKTRQALYYEANQNKVRGRCANYRAANPEIARIRQKICDKAYRKANPGKINAKTALRRARKLQATPK